MSDESPFAPANEVELLAVYWFSTQLLSRMVSDLLAQSSDKDVIYQQCRGYAKHYADAQTYLVATNILAEWDWDTPESRLAFANGIEKGRAVFLKILDECR